MKRRCLAHWISSIWVGKFFFGMNVFVDINGTSHLTYTPCNRIKIPDSVAERQLETRVQNERNDRESFVQQAQRERDLTEVEVNKINLEREAILRTAQAEAELTRARARTQADQIRVQARITALQNLLASVNITSQKDIATFDYIQSLRGRRDLNLHVSYLSDNSVVRTTAVESSE